MVTLVQKEETYNVIDDLGAGYTVTVTTDLPNLYIDYDVVDDEGEEVEDEDRIHYLIELIENNTK